MKKILCLLLTAAALLSFLPGAAAEDNIPMENRDPEKYYLELNLTNQVVTAYERDEQQQYTKIVRQMICSTGVEEFPTPAGTFKMGSMKERFGYFVYYKVYAQYWSQVVRGVYFHSVLFSRKDNKSIQSSSYRNLGRRASHGCIRLLVEDARWIYYNCPADTVLKIFNGPRDSELNKKLRPGPLKDYVIEEDPNPEPVYPTALVKTDGAALTTGFGLVDYTLTKLKKGTEVLVIQKGDPTMKVQLVETGRLGYIRSHHIVWSAFEMDHEPRPRTVVKAWVMKETPMYTNQRLTRKTDTLLSPGMEVEAESVWNAYKITFGDTTAYIPKSSAYLLERYSGHWGRVAAGALVHKEIGQEGILVEAETRVEILEEEKAGYVRVLYEHNPVYVKADAFLKDNPGDFTKA